MRDSLGLEPGTAVVDLGAGTGKFTRYLVATGAHVTAVEPVDAMRARLSAALPQVTALAGSATAIPLPDRAVDAVVCAQSFHWFGTTAALREIHRALKPGGHLGLIWNVRDENVGWVARLNQIVNQAEGDAPRYYTGAWRKAFPCPGFSSLSEQRFRHDHTGPAEQVIFDRIRSTSFIAALPPAGREEIERQVRVLVAQTPELNGRPVVSVPYETFAFHARRID